MLSAINEQKSTINALRRGYATTSNRETKQDTSAQIDPRSDCRIRLKVWPSQSGQGSDCWPWLCQHWSHTPLCPSYTPEPVWSRMMHINHTDHKARNLLMNETTYHQIPKQLANVLRTVKCLSLVDSLPSIYWFSLCTGKLFVFGKQVTFSLLIFSV